MGKRWGKRQVRDGAREGARETELMGFSKSTCTKEYMAPTLVCSLPQGLKVPSEELDKPQLEMKSNFRLDDIHVPRKNPHMDTIALLSRREGARMLRDRWYTCHASSTSSVRNKRKREREEAMRHGWIQSEPSEPEGPENNLDRVYEYQSVQIKNLAVA